MMRFLFKPNTAKESVPDPPYLSSNNHGGVKITVSHEEAQSRRRANWKVSRAGDGDTAMALFETPDQIGEPVDPKEMRRLERKIDFMILPYLAVSVTEPNLLIPADTRQMLRFLLHRQDDS